MKQFDRRKARKLALQAIYQWQYTNCSVDQLVQQYLETANPKKVDIEYFSELVTNTIRNMAEIDQQLVPFLDRDVTSLNPVVLAVLRLSVCEFLYRLDVPYKVVINEALELTKTFGSDDGYKYVNGVLDTIAKNLRSTEIKANSIG